MKITVFVMGFIIIIGCLLLLLSLPAYTPDEIRLILIILPVLMGFGLVYKL